MKSGIYIIRNKINGKLYVGSAWNCKYRKTGHLNKLRKNIHHSIRLQHSFNKYGESNFEFHILESCDRDILLTREQYWIDTLRPYYNICLIAGSSRGRKSSPAQLQSLQRGWEKRAVELSRSVIQKKQNGENVSTWSSISEAGRILGLFPQSIAFACKGKQKTAGGFIWQYI